MAFDIDIGFSSRTGRKPVNEDFCAAMLPAAGQEDMGCIVAIADGVSAGGMGREAAQTTVTSLVRDYYGTPETWDTTVALDRIIAAVQAKSGNYKVRLAGCVANRSRETDEVDRYWNLLVADGGAESQCGWLKDKFGVSWQVIPKQLGEYLGGADADGARRAMAAMLEMTKLDVEGLRRAYEGV